MINVVKLRKKKKIIYPVNKWLVNKNKKKLFVSSVKIQLTIKLIEFSILSKLQKGPGMVLDIFLPYNISY